MCDSKLLINCSMAAEDTPCASGALRGNALADATLTTKQTLRLAQRRANVGMDFDKDMGLRIEKLNSWKG